jgi:uncharacterized protein
MIGVLNFTMDRLRAKDPRDLEIVARAGGANLLHAICVWLVFTFPSETSACGPIERTAGIQIKDYPVTVELAVAEQEKNCGLSLRDALPEDHGMLFVYFEDRMMTFWMKDTRIPLSIAFLDVNGYILNILEMQALDTNTLHQSAGPARYALEMSAKWFEKHHIKAGDRVAIRLSEIFR